MSRFLDKSRRVLTKISTCQSLDWKILILKIFTEKKKNWSRQFKKVSLDTKDVLNLDWSRLSRPPTLLFIEFKDLSVECSIWSTNFSSLVVNWIQRLVLQMLMVENLSIFRVFLLNSKACLSNVMIDNVLILFHLFIELKLSKTFRVFGYDLLSEYSLNGLPLIEYRFYWSVKLAILD